MRRDCLARCLGRGRADGVGPFLLGNHLIGWYLAATSVTSVYGAAGSIVIVLLRVYYSSQVVLFPVEFTRVYAKHRGFSAGTERNRGARLPRSLGRNSLGLIAGSWARGGDW